MAKTYKIPRYRAKLARDGSVHVPMALVDTAEAAIAVARALTRDACGERFVVIFVNGSNQIVGAEIAAVGGSHGCAMTPSDVFRGAILACASAIIVAHNHPSGNARPSAADVALTSAMIAAGNVLGIPVLDHLVVTRDDAFSMHDADLLVFQQPLSEPEE